MASADSGNCVGASSSSDEAGSPPPSRRATFLTQSYVQSGVTSARSTLHAAALAGIGMGQQQKLRCASIFVSPMALSPAILDQGEDDTHAAAAARRRVTVANRLNEPRLPAVLEELDRKAAIDPDHSCRSEARDRAADGKGGTAPRGPRGKKRHHKTEHSDRDRTEDHHRTPAPDCSSAACKPAVSQLDPVSGGSSDMVMGGGDVPHGHDGEATQLSTIQVLPASAGIRQAARSVSQIELVSPPSPLSPVPGSTSVHTAGGGRGDPCSFRPAQRSMGHAHDVFTNMAFSAELWSTWQKQQQGPPADGRKFDNPLAHELQLQLSQDSRSGRSAAWAPEQMQIGMEPALANAGDAGQGRRTLQHFQHQNNVTNAAGIPQYHPRAWQAMPTWANEAPGQQMVYTGGQPVHSSGAHPTHGRPQGPTMAYSQVCRSNGARLALAHTCSCMTSLLTATATAFCCAMIALPCLVCPDQPWCA